MLMIKELVSSPNFSFNPHFRIYRYEPSTPSEERENILMYDSDSGEELDANIGWRDITAINQGEDGAVEIEYMEF